MNPTQHHSATATIIPGPDQLARLHDTARCEAIRLRREAINTFWQELGYRLRRLLATASSCGLSTTRLGAQTSQSRAT
jgi:hypothetical protein